MKMSKDMRRMMNHYLYGVGCPVNVSCPRWAGIVKFFDPPATIHSHKQRHNTKENAMFAVFQIEGGYWEYQTTTTLDYTDAQNALHELQSENPKAVFVIQKIAD